MRRHRHRSHALLAGGMLLLRAFAPPAAPAQAEPVRWRVTRDAFADLWYQGMALVSRERFGPLPLYSAAHARDVREAKRVRGVVTPLDGSAAALRAAFAADSAFEALHFVPAYFVGEDPDAVLAALRAALVTSRTARSNERSLDARAAAVAQAFPTPRERAALLAFVDALSAERVSQPHGGGTSAPGLADVTALQRAWRERLEPSLAPYLRATGLAHGMIVVVPAVGTEGRIVRQEGGLSVVVVGADSIPGVADAPLLAAVRELAFPLVDAIALPEQRRLAAERAREVAAVRAGALLLEATAPALVPAYTRLFVAGGGGTHAFETAFPLEARPAAALRAAVARYAASRDTR